MRAVLADTGPLYAQLDRDDAYHERAHQELASLSGDGLVAVVAYPTLLECHTLAMRNLGTEIGQRWLGEITSGAAALVNAVGEDYLAGSELLRQYLDQAISLHDAVLAVLSERLRLPVWTYDHHFGVMGVDVWR